LTHSLYIVDSQSQKKDKNETVGINDAIRSLKKKAKMRLDISLFSGKTILKGVKK